jgi:NAD(P)H-dependent FMN reductase
MTLDLPLLYGTVRQGRSTVDLARYVHQRLEAHDAVETRFWDAEDLPYGNLTRRVDGMEDPPEELTAWREAMGEADGFLVVTPEYNYGIPGALKNLLDLTYEEWNRKPFAFAAGGGTSGGLRAIDHARQVVAGLGAVVVPRHVHSPYVGDTFDEGEPVEEEARWRDRVDGLVDELVWYAEALEAMREG